MTAYELMVKANHYLIKGGELTDTQRENITGQLLEAMSDGWQSERLCRGVNFPSAAPNISASSDGRRLYPTFFIPPYNGGKKYKTILGQTPKTQILSSNMYELEIIRLLKLLNPRDNLIGDITLKTLERLKTTCFGYMDDGLGECFDVSLIVLRFLATCAPDDTLWIQSRIDNYNRHKDEKKRPWFAKWYFLLCLSELRFDIAKPEIDIYKSDITDRLANKSCVMNSETDKLIHPVLLCILRNTLSRYPEYSYIKSRLPYTSETDNRLHFNMESEI